MKHMLFVFTGCQPVPDEDLVWIGELFQEGKFGDCEPLVLSSTGGTVRLATTMPPPTMRHKIAAEVCGIVGAQFVTTTVGE